MIEEEIMTEDEIEELKQKIKDGWAMAHDPECSKGFEAADTYISYLEMRIALYKGALDSIVAGANCLKDSMQEEE